MAEFNLIETVLIAIIFIIVAVGGRIYLIDDMGKAYLEEKITGDDLDKITVTHMIKDCLTQDIGYIDSAFLDASNEKNICDLCGICNIAAEAEVMDMETGMIWSFKYDSFSHLSADAREIITTWKRGTHETHQINVNIRSGDEVHVGEFNVEA